MSSSSVEAILIMETPNEDLLLKSDIKGEFMQWNSYTLLNLNNWKCYE